MSGLDLTLDLMTALSQPWLGWLLVGAVTLQAVHQIWRRWSQRRLDPDPLLSGTGTRNPIPERPLYSSLAAAALELTVIWALASGTKLYTAALWKGPQANAVLTLSDRGLTVALVAAWTILVYLWFWESYFRPKSITRGRLMGEVDHLSPEAFRVFVAVLFRMRGYQAQVNLRDNGQGVDIILENLQGQRELVRCEARDGPFGENAVRGFHAAMLRDQAAVGGYIITTGEFTGRAREWAARRSIRLVDNQDLLRAVRTTPRSEIDQPIPALATARS
ncbi:MAG: restriction endonuclease [Anaerolineales bacterium]|jgi:HJR/Mrr/RecB family endonuclease